MRLSGVMSKGDNMKGSTLTAIIAAEKQTLM